MQTEKLMHKILDGDLITREEAQALALMPLDELCASALTITRTFFGEEVELCAISNGKNGHCTEDCKFCAQAEKVTPATGHAKLKTAEEFFAEAKSVSDQGVHRFSIVTAGVRLSKKEIAECARAVQLIVSQLPISCCVSLGLLAYEDFKLLKEHGVTRIHCNLETSRRYFPQICQTHSFDDKLSTLAAARSAGLEICSGCIIGMGETQEDRIDLAFSLREVGACSVPVNILNPIKGTPLEHMPPLPLPEIKRSIALFRHILPHAVLRLAGGRILIKDQYTELYQCGINALITGDMLTTCGLSVMSDQQMLKKLALKSALIPPKFKEI